MIRYRSPNEKQAKGIIQILAERGVSHVCIAPGSRSTPLTLAAAALPTLIKTVFYDERSLGFYALGLAKASGKPVAIITTSGTAVANLFPALIEAFYTHVPLIAITADRPPELHHVGSNQTIEQEHIFGTYMKTAITLNCPEDSDLESDLNQVNAAILRHKGGSQAGPIHINCAYREPLVPPDAPYLEWDWSPQKEPQHTETGSWDHALFSGKTVGIIAGHLTPKEASAVEALQKTLSCPIWTDINSQLRFKPLEKTLNRESLSAMTSCDLILQFGTRVIDAAAMMALTKLKKDWVVISEYPEIENPYGGVTHQITMAISKFCQEIVGLLKKSDLQIPTREMASQDPVAAFLSQTLQKLSGEFMLFCGNSSPIRQLDHGVKRTGQTIQIHSNRGASGIDGIISTAIGMAHAQPLPVLLVLGDLSFLHDQGALGMMRHHPGKLCIIVINNDGGGIFKTLPVAKEKEVFDPYFKTPHGITFEAISRQYGFEYECVILSDAKTEKKLKKEVWATSAQVIEVNATQA